MSDFSADWLALREPADHLARNAPIRDAVLVYLGRREAVRVTDLACGTGSTLRALAPHLGQSQAWHLVDRDAGLLGRAKAACAATGVPAVFDRADLDRDLEAVLARPADLLTTSAFLDLVSRSWLERLATAAAARRRPVYAALSVDGRLAAQPAHALDGAVFAAFNRHQHRDKGLGDALGPLAVAAAAAIFASRGYQVATGLADWVLGAEAAALQRRLVAGWYQAVAESGAVSAPDLVDWQAARMAALARDELCLTVGHVDLWAVPGHAP
ncbi:MAG: class I SAM-dependent methyltransferase [Alphaproteobacteria bacterium]|nr:class I SAM-dependent methyltransferase [Alphaproteobacteria bacterium]